MVNENNYIGASATVVGYAASEARNPAYDKDGSKGVLEISIPINEGYKKDGDFVQTSVTWYTYSAAGDYAANLKSIHKGDKVRIDDAKQEVREYTNKEGEKVKAISLRFGTITVIEASSRAEDGFSPSGVEAGF